MNPTKQTILHDPANGKFGNCLSAVIASLLHMNIDDVPVFADPDTWIKDLNEFLRPFGLAYILFTCSADWLKDIGVDGCHHEVFGPTIRSNDVLHANVALDGRAIFDPHPDNSGLTRVEGFGVFIALRPWEYKELSEALHG